MKLVIENLSKSYGAKKALSDVTLSLVPGIHGLLGANGSGKTTLMNIISQNLTADHGSVQLDPPMDMLETLGWMPQQQAIYKAMSARAFLHYMAKLKALPAPKAQIEDLLDRMNLVTVAHKPMGTYSGGMKQRVLLAQALLGDPQVLLLDEPTAGLDPSERIRFRNLISAYAMDRIIIYATHVVSDIEYVADNIIMLKDGHVLGSAPSDAWLKSIHDKVFEIHAQLDEVAHYQSNFQVGNIQHSIDGITLRIVSDECPSPDATLINPVLEDVYLYYNSEDTSHARLIL